VLELQTGTITIDGIDISKLPRQEVRKRVNTVPQETFFMHGSVRDNVDPLLSVCDERIIEVLRMLQLWELFEARGGLDEELVEDTLSSTQRRLFCLARAILKQGHLLVMDEATSG
jgi:ATP-binding cassette subfamily C (CFTR/MRP) protein 1